MQVPDIHQWLLRVDSSNWQPLEAKFRFQPESSHSQSVISMIMDFR
jgi:hypothetical protein